MSLNIKNPEAHELAHQLASLTGESMAAVVTEALREKLERTRQGMRKPLAERLIAIGNDCASRLTEPLRSADHGELLYGENGLPR